MLIKLLSNAQQVEIDSVSTALFVHRVLKREKGNMTGTGNKEEYLFREDMGIWLVQKCSPGYIFSEFESQCQPFRRVRYS